MKILVTGGNGFIARYVIEEALADGHEVFTNTRMVGNVMPDYFAKCTVYLIDSRDKIGMRSIIEKVDGVINLAGILGTKHVDNAKDFYENNVFSALNVYDACTEFDIPVVQIAVGNHFETNNYSNSKTAAERDCLMYTKYSGMKGNVVRGLNVVGPYQKVKNTGKIAPTFITQALKGEDLKVYGGMDKCGIMDFIYVRNIAKILLEVLQSGSYGNVYEAGTGLGHSVWDIANEIVRLTKSRSKVVAVPMRAGEGEQSRVVAENPYPFEYTSLEDMLELAIDYYRDHAE